VCPVEDEDPSGKAQDEMGGKKDNIGLVEIMIVFYRVVDDDREEDDGAADQAVDKGIGEFGQPGFLVEGIVRPEQGIEKQPAYGDGSRTQPEAGGQQQSVIDNDRFREQDAAAEMKNIGGQEGRDIIAEDIPKDRDGM
jgi:hypothetical protein